MRKPTICLDFDGVIHSYVSGWKGVDVIPDKPCKNCKEMIKKLREDYKVVVFSSRCNCIEGVKAIHVYLTKYNIIVDEICKDKPPAMVYIDDRGICFKGWNNELLELINHFKPYKEV